MYCLCLLLYQFCLKSKYYYLTPKSKKENYQLQLTRSKKRKNYYTWLSKKTKKERTTTLATGDHPPPLTPPPLLPLPLPPLSCTDHCATMDILVLSKSFLTITKPHSFHFIFIQLHIFYLRILLKSIHLIFIRLAFRLSHR